MSDNNNTKQEESKQDKKVKQENKVKQEESNLEKSVKQENTKSQETKIEQQETNSYPKFNIFILLCILGVFVGLVLEVILDVEKRNEPRSYTAEAVTSDNAKENGKRKYWVFPQGKLDDREGILKHVHTVLERVGWESTANETPWDLLWAHHYPFTTLKPHLFNLQPHQKVNHFPGTGYITVKVHLATSESKYIPRAFQLPSQKQQFLEYAKKNGNSTFLLKNNRHRDIVLKNVSDIPTDNTEHFVQEFLRNPFLVDGYKFDIGVYTVITSVDPLRVYVYKGDVLFRYCQEKYHPLDPKNVKQYVIGDHYRPTWEVPALAAHAQLGFGMKDCFDHYAGTRGMDTTAMWNEIDNAIRETIIKNEKHIIESLKSYASPDSFFEMMRFDFIVDEALGVYLLEANLSPNLSSEKRPNQLLYEQILYNLFSLVGVSRPVVKDHDKSDVDDAVSTMVSADKNIAVFPAECAGCGSGCAGACALCGGGGGGCRPPRLRRQLLRAHYEHLHRGDFRRIFPPPMNPNDPPDATHFAHMSTANQLQYMWYQDKCNLDQSWCH